MQMAALAGGVTWWLLRGRDRSYEWEGASEGWRDRHPLESGHGLDTDYTDSADQSLREKAGEYVSSARETVSEYATSARETVGEYASSASNRARETWQRTSTTVDDFVHDNPLAAGAIAIAVGVAIGLSAPSTEWEDRTLGERRDQAMERAREKARELKDTVAQRAKNVANTVADLTAPAGAAGATGATSASGVGVSGTSTTGSV
jgi:ElaB/YqjD/DUF883 family membrane-anchored ribosome-binding protein